MMNRSLLNVIKLGKEPFLPTILTGIEIKVAVVEDPPFSDIVYGSNGSISKVNGYLGKLWKILEDQMRFRTEWVQPAKGFLGENHNGTWDGMLGELQKGEADVALINLAITRDRKAIADFSSSVTFDSSRLLSHSNSDAEGINWMIFLTALSWQIWVCVAVLWISLSVSLAFVARKEEESSSYNYLFALFGAITLQGCELSPNNFQGRLIFISFWAMCVVMYASFTARLTTQLTAPNSIMVNTLEHSLEKGFKICVLSDSNQHQIFMESKTNEMYNRIGKHLLENPQLVVQDVEKALELVATNRQIMFLYDLSTLQYVTRRNCSFRIEPTVYFPGYLHLPYRKNLPYAESLNKMILRINANGALRKLASDWQNSLGLGACTLSAEGIPSLGLGKTLFAFVVLAGGAIVASISLLGEISAKKLNKLSQKKSPESFPSKSEDFFRRNVLRNNFFDSYSTMDLNQIASFFNR